MIADAHPEPIKTTSKRVFYGKAVAPTGSTITINGTATVTLYDKKGVAAGGISGVSVSGQETGAQAELLAWFILDPSSPPSGVALTPGPYHLEFVINGDGSDGINRDFTPCVFILVESASA